jgi:hypothetical protein
MNKQLRASLGVQQAVQAACGAQPRMRSGSRLTVPASETAVPGVNAAALQDWVQQEMRQQLQTCLSQRHQRKTPSLAGMQRHFFPPPPSLSPCRRRRPSPLRLLLRSRCRRPLLRSRSPRHHQLQACYTKSLMSTSQLTYTLWPSALTSSKGRLSISSCCWRMIQLRGGKRTRRRRREP